MAYERTSSCLPWLLWRLLVVSCLVASIAISYGNVRQWLATPAMVENVEVADVVVSGIIGKNRGHS